MSPEGSDQLTRSLRSDSKALQSVIESMLLKILVSLAQQADRLQTAGTMWALVGTPCGTPDAHTFCASPDTRISYR